MKVYNSTVHDTKILKTSQVFIKLVGVYGGILLSTKRDKLVKHATTWMISKILKEVRYK